MYHRVCYIALTTLICLFSIDLRMAFISIARDYLAIPASSAIDERSFSLSGRTDDSQRRGQLKKAKFGGLQKVQAGYLLVDGWLNVEGDIMVVNILVILLLMMRNI